jgi:polyhydroxyalkanoate synthesis regulator phasin
MTEPNGNGPMGPEDELAALAGLDLALDELAAGRDLPTEGVGGETAALATLATELRAAVPPPPPGAAERGREAFLAAAGATGCRARGTTWRRSLPLRLAAVAAALVVVVALPAAARQARPGTALWPVREAAQQVRDRLADDPVERARLRLDVAESYLAAGRGAGEERRKDMADHAEDKIKDALDVLDDVAGPEAAAQRARAQQLLLQVDALEHQQDPDDRSGSGSGSGSGGSSGPGGGGDDDRSGRGGDDGGGSGSGSGSGSVSGKSGSGSGSESEKSGSGDGSGSGTSSGSDDD